MTLIDDCYNANPMSMRAALDDLAATAARSPGARRVAVLGDMLELGPDERRFHAEIGEHASGAGVDVLVTVGPLAAAMAERFDGETARGRRRRRGRRARCRSCSRRGDVVLVKASRGVGLELVCRALQRRGARLMGSISGRILIAGTASLLMCLFLSPKFIEFLRRNQFGQNIREEGPEGHQAKAGTPTIGGIIIFIAFAVPFLILSKRDWQSIGVFGAALACALLGFADDYTKIVKRRSLGPAGADEAGGHDRDLARAVVGRDAEGGPSGERQAAVRRRQHRLRPPVPGVHLPRRGRHDQRGQPDRRSRRPGRGVRRDRAARVHRDHVHHRPDSAI